MNLGNAPSAVFTMFEDREPQLDSFPQLVSEAADTTQLTQLKPGLGLCHCP